MNRKDRRADPARWYAIDAYIDKGETSPVPLGQYEQHVHARIEDIVVVKMPAGLSPTEAGAFIQGFRETIAMAETTLDFVMVPASVEFFRIRPVEAAHAKELERRLRLKRIERQVQAEKAAAAESKKPS